MTAPEHLDVLIVGAGLSGIGAAHHLRTAFPARSLAILEARDAIGGTWDLFRYPGVRSDSDMHTLGYRFRPWTADESIADGPAILQYVRDTARETGTDQLVRFGHRVVSADWDSATARWTVEARRGAETVRFTCDFLYLCSGYYRYDHGHSPAFPGTEDFRGRIVHPQHWPADLDHTGARVVLIGSGATAVTLVPALAERAAHVTMLQRSPTYVVSVPSRDRIDLALRRIAGHRAAYTVTRWKNVLIALLTYGVSRRWPRLMKSQIRKDLLRQLPPGYDVDTHFAPHYNPWDQRLCAVPDGDLFRAIAAGRADVVTDRIATFTGSGIRLDSGRELEADVVVTATGLSMLLFGGIRLSVDGREVSTPDTLVYKGSMLSGVPNMAFTLGYTNSSWTLKADIVAQYVCRVLRHMDERRHRCCVPVPADPAMPRRPLIDLTAGYVRRALSELPSSGTGAPWRVGASYPRDLLTLRHGRIADGELRFGGPVPRAGGLDGTQDDLRAVG